MGFDAEDVLVCAWVCFKFVGNSSYRCVQKYPCVSGILIFFLLLYVFFNIIILFFPLFVCTAISIGFFLRSKPPTSQDIKGNVKKNDHISHGFVKNDIEVNRNVGSYSHPRGVRRNVSENEKEGDLQVGNREKDMVSLVTSRDDLVGGNAQADKYSSITNAITDSDSSKPELLASDGSNEPKLKLETACSIDVDADVLKEAEEEEDMEEEVQEEGSKVVEWTEDDQKNLVDLGLSEIERNKRLEILIARRRARKSFKMQIENDINKLGNSSSQIAPIIAPLIIARNMPDFISNNGGLQVPGSAPSILLPNQNPFDLPYEPHEEKPNLMADSFQQEFSAIHQKDIQFCRHESFCYGPFSAGKREGTGYSKFKRPSEIRAGRSSIEIGSLLPTKEVSSKILKREGDVETKSDKSDVSDESNIEISKFMEQCVIDDVPRKSTSLSSSSSDINERYFSGSNTEDSKTLESTLASAAETFTFSLSKSKSPTDPIYDSSSNLINKREKKTHTPTQSIASDLQVEVSETGSPPYTITGNNSPTIFDTEIETDEVQGVRVSQSSENLEAHPLHEALLEKPKEPFEVEVADKLPKLESSMHIEGSFEKPADYQQEDFEGSREGNKNLELKQDLEKPMEQEGTTNMSKPIEGKDNMKLVHDRKNEPTSRQEGVSGAIRNSIDPIAVAVHKSIVEVLNRSSLTPSPTSSLPKEKMNDKLFSSDSNQKMQKNVQQSNGQGTMESSSTYQRLSGDGFEKSQEPKTAPGESPKASIPKANDPVVSEKEDKEKLMAEKESEAKVDAVLKYLIKPTVEGNLEARKDDGDEDNALTKPYLQSTQEQPNAISKFLEEDVSKANHAIEGEKEDKEKLKIDKEIEGKVEPTIEKNLETKKDVGGEVVALSKPNEPIEGEKEDKEKLKTNKESESIVEESRDLKPPIEDMLKTKKDVLGEVTAISKPNESIEGEMEDNEKLKTKQESESIDKDLRDLKPSIKDKLETKKDGGGEDVAAFRSNNTMSEMENKLNIEKKNEGGILQAIKDVADKVVAPFKANEEIESRNGDNEKLTIEKGSEGKVEDSTKATIEGKVNVGIEIATSKSNDAVASEKEDKLNTEKKSEEGILEAIKDIADKTVATFKPNEAIENENGDNEKLKTEKESGVKVEDLRKSTIEGKLEGKNDVGVEVATTSNDAVMSEKEDKLNTEKTSKGGILEAIKDVPDKFVAIFKSNETIESGNGENEKLKAEKESESKVENLTKQIMEGKLESEKDVGVEVSTTSTSNDAVISEKEDNLNTKKSEGGILEVVKDVAGKVVTTLKPNEEVENGKENKEKLKTGKESDGKAEDSRDLTKPINEEKLEAIKDARGEVVSTSKSNDIVVSEKKDKLNQEKKSEGKDLAHVRFRELEFPFD